MCYDDNIIIAIITDVTVTRLICGITRQPLNSILLFYYKSINNNNDDVDDDGVIIIYVVRV